MNFDVTSVSFWDGSGGKMLDGDTLCIYVDLRGDSDYLKLCYLFAKSTMTVTSKLCQNHISLVTQCETISQHVLSKRCLIFPLQYHPFNSFLSFLALR